MLRLVVADRVSRALRQEADVRRNHEFFNGRNVARTPLSTAGHERTVAVTSEFLAASGIEWPVFGDQVELENFRTRPLPDCHRLRAADTQGAAPL